MCSYAQFRGGTARLQVYILGILTVRNLPFISGLRSMHTVETVPDTVLFTDTYFLTHGSFLINCYFRSNG